MPEPEHKRVFPSRFPAPGCRYSYRGRPLVVRAVRHKEGAHGEADLTWEDTGEEVTPSGFTWVRHAPASFGGNDRPEGERRQALAEWITHPENPLTRRTMVNRLWHHHFGQGIVTTPSDFGLGGDRPSHPELLDWLATEFQRNGWRLKPLHRLIVMSAAYRQSALTVDAKAERFTGPDAAAANALLTRADRAPFVVPQLA